MTLTNEFLKDVAYYTHNVKRNVFSHGHADVFIFHFKQWWRPRKKLQYQGIVHWNGSKFVTFRSELAQQIAEQLDEYFQKQKE